MPMSVESVLHAYEVLLSFPLDPATEMELQLLQEEVTGLCLRHLAILKGFGFPTYHGLHRDDFTTGTDLDGALFQVIMAHNGVIGCTRGLKKWSPNLLVPKTGEAQAVIAGLLQANQTIDRIRQHLSLSETPLEDQAKPAKMQEPIHGRELTLPQHGRARTMFQWLKSIFTRRPIRTAQPWETPPEIRKKLRCASAGIDPDDVQEPDDGKANEQSNRPALESPPSH